MARGDKLKDARPGFSIIYNDFYDRFARHLGPNGIAVYVALLRHADKEGENAYPAYATIAAECGMGRTTVVKYIDKLIEFGLVAKETRYTSKGQASNLYTVADSFMVSSPNEPPGVREANSPPFASRTHPRSPGEHDQYTINNTPINNTSARESSTRDRATPPSDATPTHARAIANAESETFDGPADKTPKAPVSSRRSHPTPPIPPSPCYDGRKFAKGGRIPAGKGATAVEVYYESFSIRADNERLSDLAEDDLTNLCTDLDKLRAVCTAYRRTPHRRGNLQLILDWYSDGVPQKGKRNESTKRATSGTHTPAGSTAPSVDPYARYAKYGNGS